MPVPIKLYFKPVKLDEVILVDEFLDYSVLFNSLTAETMGLNSLGLNIWNEIDGEKSINEIASRICKKYDVLCDMAIPDTEEFIKKLYRRMFIIFSHEEIDLSME